MEENKLKAIIEKTIDSYIMDIWITPYYCRKYIPSENIPKLKEALYENIKGGAKNGKKS